MITTIIDDQKLTVSGDWEFLAGFLAEYIGDGEHRTGQSMHLAYQRMVQAGDITDPDPDLMATEPIAFFPSLEEDDDLDQSFAPPPVKQSARGFWGNLFKALGF
jgi:hypothetical protein